MDKGEKQGSGNTDKSVKRNNNFFIRTQQITTTLNNKIATLILYNEKYTVACTPVVAHDTIW